MSHFEYISVFVSIILALGIARLLDGIGPALRADGRSLVLVGWIVQKFLNIVLWWWTLWFALDATWNLGLFVFEMVVPIVLYLQCRALTTPSIASPGDWRVRFEEIRTLFFVGNIVLVISVFLIPVLFDGNIGLQIASSVPALSLLLVIAVIGIVFPHPRVQGVLVTVALIIQLLGLGSAIFVVN